MLYENEVSGIFDSIAKPFKAVGKIAKKVIRSPVLKATAMGAAFVFPPIGVPAAAAVVAADKVVGALDKGGRKAAAARKLLKPTLSAAKSGDKDAARGARALTLAARLRKQGIPVRTAVARARVKQAVARRPVARSAARPAAGAMRGVLVLPGGRVVTGTFQRTA